jgi:hypothetical protein
VFMLEGKLAIVGFFLEQKQGCNLFLEGSIVEIIGMVRVLPLCVPIYWIWNNITRYTI